MMNLQVMSTLVVLSQLGGRNVKPSSAHMDVLGAGMQPKVVKPAASPDSNPEAHARRSPNLDLSTWIDVPTIVFL